ncbi:hypothetical protein AWB73_00124 [Caballeronia turbans]|nr:hypothetical protein AWB73_00124 [Caballeronia turbans]
MSQYDATKFPTSYKDPVYAAADEAASAAAGIPPGLLTSIRVAGEKSNANQISSAQAATPYQVTPATRDLLIKKYKIDPYSSPEAAALGAAYLLKEGIQRTGSAAGAVTQYIGGTDPSNWGGQTRAYTNRVMSHFTKGGGTDTPDAQPMQPQTLPSAASYGLDPTVAGVNRSSTTQPVNVSLPQPAAAPGAGPNAQIVADYNAGRLSPEDMKAVEQRAAQIGIDSSQLQAPGAQGAPSGTGAPIGFDSAKGAAPQTKTIGPQTLAAMQNGSLTPDQLAVVKKGLADGSLTMPANAPAPQPQQDNSWSPLGGVADSSMPTKPMTPTTAAQNGSTWSDIAEKGVGGVASGLLNIAAAGGRLVGANDFADQAVNARKQVEAQVERDTNHSLAGKVAGVVGEALPYVSAGGASLPTAVAGGAVAGAVPAIAENKSGAEIARDAAVGGAAGAAGLGLGKVAGTAVSSLAENPTIAKAIAKAQGWFGKSPSAATATSAAGNATDAHVAADIAHASGQTPDQLATKLETAPAPQTPGYTPTAAEMANDANVTAVQKLSTNHAGTPYAKVNAQNDAAILSELEQKGATNNPGTPANPQAAEQAAETAAQRSDALAAQGQGEVQPVSTALAQKLQTPQFEAPVKLAQRMARDEGSSVFDDLQRARQADAASTLEQIIGTPEQLEAMKAARGAQAADDFLSTNIGVPADDPALKSLLERPAIKKALAQAQADAQNQGQTGIFTTANPRGNANMGGSKGAPQQYVSGRGLVGIKTALDDQIGAAAAANEQGQVKTLQGLKSQLLSFMDNAIPEYGTARANYAKASGPIDAMQSVQQRLYSAVDPVSKEVDPGKLVSAINSIKAEQMKPGIRPADKVDPTTLDALTQLAGHLQNKNDLTGLSGEGQEYIRRALASSEKHAGAQAEFHKILDAQSPAYKELHGSHAQQVGAIESQKASQTALAQAEEAIQNADSPGGLKALDKLLPNMEAADRAKAIALRQERARELALDAVKGARKNAEGGVEVNREPFQKVKDQYSPYMSTEDVARFGKVADDLHQQTVSYSRLGKIAGSDTAQNQNAVKRFGANLGAALKDSAVQAMIAGGVGTAFGPVGTIGGMAAGAITGALSRTITQKVSSITTENAAKLLSNGKLLAAALRNYESLAARRAFIQGLAAKVGFVGGATAANQFNQSR